MPRRNRTLAHRAMRRAALIIALAAIAGCAAFAWITNNQTGPLTMDGAQSCTVAKVVDGDTLWADCGGARVDKIRIIGLDTPETKDPRKPIQCFGPEASAYAKKLLPKGTQVHLREDPTQAAIDKYNRRLAYVWLSDGRLYEEVMISQGYGREYTYAKPYQAQKQLKAAQKQAQQKKAGLWGACP